MKKYIPIIVSTFAASVVVAQVLTNSTEVTQEESQKPSEVSWSPLNPARGNKGPQAANLWNDRTEQAASGFLVKFKDGFQSPPHIHNVTYRGVVISGEVHNDDPEAEKMWMAQGAFWTQPAGQVHITSARGKEVIAYIEIDSGPYLVKPTEQAFDTGERPINVDPSNLMWLSASDTDWISHGEDSNTRSPELAFLWGDLGDKGVNGTFVRLPRGYVGEIIPKDPSIRVVVVSGLLEHGESAENMRQAGEYLGLSQNENTIRVSNTGDEETVLYIRSLGGYRIVSGEKNE